MVILQAFLALAAGFAVLTLLAMALSAVVGHFIPSWAGEPAKPEPTYALVALGSTFLSTLFGGYVTALVASANPLIHVLALAIIVLALAALSALQSRGKQPIWYQLAQVAISPVGVLAGGLLRLSVLGIL